MNSLSPNHRDLISFAKSAMIAESEAIRAASTLLGREFEDAVATLLSLKGKVVVTGLGKSGHVARKLAATLASTGTPSFFLHPSEALHGDLGMISGGDGLLAIAFGGETIEVLEVARHAKRLGVPVVAVTGKQDSSLGRLSDYVLDGSVGREVCPLNLAPTASTAVALALGDAIAVSLMNLRGFSEVDFAALHPGGSLGRRLSTVEDHMRRIGESFSAVSSDTGFHDVIKAVTTQNFGIVPVMDGSVLVGAISDGDIRRSLLKFEAKALEQSARDLMTRSPRTIVDSSLALDAFKTMEQFQITSLFVLSAKSPTTLVGIIRMHDLLAAKIV